MFFNCLSLAAPRTPPPLPKRDAARSSGGTSCRLRGLAIGHSCGLRGLVLCLMAATGAAASSDAAPYAEATGSSFCWLMGIMLAVLAAVLVVTGTGNTELCATESSYYFCRWQSDSGSCTARGRLYCTSKQLSLQQSKFVDIVWMQLQSVVVACGAAELQASQYVTAKLRQALCLYEETMDPVSALLPTSL